MLNFPTDLRGIDQFAAFSLQKAFFNMGIGIPPFLVRPALNDLGESRFIRQIASQHLLHEFVGSAALLRWAVRQARFEFGGQAHFHG